jgi:hypothetical protein
MCDYAKYYLCLLQVSVNTIHVYIEGIYTVTLLYDMFRPFFGHHQVSYAHTHFFMLFSPYISQRLHFGGGHMCYL